MKHLKSLITGLIILVLTGLLFTWWSNNKIEKDTAAFVTDDVGKLPNKKTGLVLGTSKTLSGGQKNPYFYYRIDAAEQLYKAGKVQYLIVSGDNSQKDYNEPEDMRNELVSRGIPEGKIFLDFAGFRTLDSVVRAKEIFGQNSFIVISQEFHNERAVFLARKNGIDAYGFNAKDVNKKAGFKTNLREYFARVKVFFDFLLNVDPKFGGEKVSIP